MNDNPYEWKITKLGIMSYRWDVYKRYSSEGRFNDGGGYAMTRWGAKRLINKHYAKRINPPVRKDPKVYEGKFN